MKCSVLNDEYLLLLTELLLTAELKVEISLREEEEQKKMGGTAAGACKGSIPLVPGFLEVMDLLKNLPEATNKTLASAATPKEVGFPTTTVSTATSIVTFKPGDSTTNIRTRLAHVSPSKKSKKEGIPVGCSSISGGSSVIAITTQVDSEVSTSTDLLSK